MTQAFNLSQFANFVDSTGKASLTTGVTGVLPVANGGTGASTLTSNALLVGNGTSNVNTLTGTNGKIVAHNGTTWISSDPFAGIGGYQVFTTSGSWTVPGGISKAFVYVAGGAGGGSTGSPNPSAKGGAGASVIAYISTLTAGTSITVTVGTGGAGTNFGATGGNGNTSSFGTYITCTGGTGAVGSTSGTTGTITLSSATAMRFGSSFIGNTGTTSGIGNLTWSTSYTEAPGTGMTGSPSTASNGNGMGGAVMIIW